MSSDLMHLDDERKIKYNLVLTFKHPTINPSEISARLGLTPTNSWIAGEDRQTPSGRKLDGQNHFSFWTMVKRFDGNRDFFKSVVVLLDQLETLATFVNQVSDSGGMVSIIIQVSGKRNIGSEIGWADLKRVAALKISLGLEVFPDF